MISNEQLQFVARIRAKSISNETVSLEEYKEAIRIMRGDRLAAAQASEGAKRAKAKKEIPSADSLLDDLMGGS